MGSMHEIGYWEGAIDENTPCNPMSMYGIAKDVSIPWAGIISSRTKIPNLLLTGQSITSHGMLGVLAGSFLTCAEVLSFDDIMSQLISVA